VLRALNRRLAVALAGVLAVSGLVALEAPTADAYNVCSDPGAPCTHERMSAYGIALLAPGSEAAIFAQDIWDGAGHEDVFDHIYGIPFHEILEAAIITMTPRSSRPRTPSRSHVTSGRWRSAPTPTGERQRRTSTSATSSTSWET
jgi:hypothetical protein